MQFGTGYKDKRLKATLKNKNKYMKLNKINKLIIDSRWGLSKIAFLLIAIFGGMYATGSAIDKVGSELIIAPAYATVSYPEIERPITEPTVEQVKEEIRKQSVLFGVNTHFALDLADCESGFDYKAKNPNSTARGVYQYLIATWETTESAKAGLERNNYKANIREAMIDIANGEHYQKWAECIAII